MTDGSTDSANLPLMIVDPLIEPKPEPIQAGESYDSLTLSEKVSVTTYYLTPAEKSVLQGLTDVGKTTYLPQYWTDRDAKLTGPHPATRAEAVKRFKYCNQYFSRDNKHSDGWATDQGRIYMIYGPWEDRIDMPAPRIGNPFVVWYYRSIKEGKMFVFEDKRGDHDFILVHSNVDGERYNADWANRLKEEMMDVK